MIKPLECNTLYISVGLLERYEKKKNSPNNFIDIVFFIKLLHRSNKISAFQLSKSKAASSGSVNVVKYSVDDRFSWVINEG